MSRTKDGSVRLVDVGRAEPGFEKFAAVAKRAGTSEEALAQYGKIIGALRRLAPKALLELSPEEVEALDEALLNKAGVYRTLLKMFYRAHKRHDLLDALPRQRRQKRRRIGLDDVLTPEDVQAMIAECGNLRDRAILALLAATGGRVNEVLGLRVRDLRQVNGGYQAWFGATKVRSQERYSPVINGVWKKHVDAWIAAHPAGKDAILLPSTITGGKLAGTNVATMIKGIAKKAGVTKATNPHSFRHARVTWGIIAKEDLATLCIGIWGKPTSNQLNRYAHFSGIDTTIETREIEMADVPAMPVPPVLATTKEVQSLREQIAEVRETEAKFTAFMQGRMFVVQTDELQAALDAGARVIARVPDGSEVIVAIGGKMGDPVTGNPVLAQKEAA